MPACSLSDGKPVLTPFIKTAFYNQNYSFNDKACKPGSLKPKPYLISPHLTAKRKRP